MIKLSVENKIIPDNCIIKKSNPIPIIFLKCFNLNKFKDGDMALNSFENPNMFKHKRTNTGTIDNKLHKSKKLILG